MNSAILKQERANAVSHGIGAVLSVAALVLLLERSIRYGTIWHVISFAIFGVTMLLVYVSSTLLHSARDERWIERFEKMDHAAIFLLIGGTYTPYLLVTLRGSLGLSFLAIVWSLALGGLVFKLRNMYRYHRTTTFFYIALGWMIILLFKPLQEQLPVQGLSWLVYGGALYTIGTVFYLWRRVPYHHAIWHTFVMGGSLCHFISIYVYVLPR
ncbi:hemolysin III family protein [Paenibacillus sp. YYML68]|uniref:PAQR family membrane homeostasis protein TrhA n=1 Tax=Paenibacillus sp. YYML68 TaxID=2909250 RepID=UPI002490F071|nr:hemolysin III family protein [Paenibacillus sp. YYML68]